MTSTWRTLSVDVQADEPLGRAERTLPDDARAARNR